MFSIYCEDLDANRNWIIDLLVNGVSIEVPGAPFGWVSGAHNAAMVRELAAVRALVAAFEADYAALGC